MQKVTKSLFLILFCLVFTVIGYSQNRPGEGTIGLTASFQDNQANLMIPFWTTDNIVIAPIFGVIHESDSFTTINIGVKPRFYRETGNDFASYVGFQSLLQYTSPEVGDEVTNFLLGAVGGGEYFLDDHFSLGVEGQLNFLIRDSANNRLATGAAISGTYYF